MDREPHILHKLRGLHLLHAVLIPASPRKQERRNDARRSALVSFLALLLLPLPALADGLGLDAVRHVLSVIFVAALLIVGFMVTFIVLAVSLGRRLRDGRDARSLVLATRVLAVLWGLAALSPLLSRIGGSDAGGERAVAVSRDGKPVPVPPPPPRRVAGEAGWMLVFILVAGLPAHIPAGIALGMARRAARRVPSAPVP